MDKINIQLREWVDAQWSQLQTNDFLLNPAFHAAEDPAPKWQALTGDAGFRRYFRLASEPPLLAVYAPPSTENTQAFIDIAKHLRDAGVLTPAVAAYDLARGFLLIEDLGADLMLQKLNDDSVTQLYAESLKALLQIQLSPADTQIFPAYNQQRLRDEMALFPRWFVQELLHLPLTEQDNALLDTVFSALESSALSQPQVVVHRDFHSRNLIHRESGPPGVIDFQDAVVGPITYDLVSLLKDCYIAWPEERVQSWAVGYLQLLQSVGKLKDVEAKDFVAWFDWMGLQRHIKVLGIFARLSLRDGKHHYLNDLPLVVRYTLQASQKYPALKPFYDWFQQKLMPVIVTQSWYEG